MKTMKLFLFTLIAIPILANANVCNRSIGVASALESKFQKSCDTITDVDLAGMKTFSLAGDWVALKANDLAGMTKLTQISFREATLKTFPNVPGGFFSQNPNLEFIDLTGIKGLQSLPENLFQGLPYLKKLSIHNIEKITTFPEGLFAGLKNLTYLGFALSEHPITLPENIFAGLDGLVELHIRGSVKDRIPTADLKTFRYLEKIVVYFEDLPYEELQRVHKELPGVSVGEDN